MFALGNEFPNVSYNDADLRELIRLYELLVKTYDSLQDEIQQAMDFINSFEQTTNDKIQQEITIVMAHYQQRLLAVEKLVHALEIRLTANENEIDTFQPQINDLAKALKEQKYYVDNLHQELIEELHEYKNGVGKYIDGRLYLFEEEIRRMVTKLDRLDVVNPINGQYEDINKVLSDLYQSIQLSFGITAKEYDKLQLTAREYDNMMISAIDYSTKAYFIFWEMRQGLMRSPFTGLMTNYKNIINKLADLHKCGFTAKQYDNLQITAKDFDAWKISAFNYDWFGRKMILKKEGITALQFDNLKISAKEYDEKKVTAYQYDTYGRAILESQTITTCNCMSCNPDVLQPN